MRRLKRSAGSEATECFQGAIKCTGMDLFGDSTTAFGEIA